MSEPTVKDLQTKAHELIDKHEMYAAMCCDNGDKEQAQDHIQIARVLRLSVTIHEATTTENAGLRTRLQTAEQTIRYCNDLLAPVIGDLAAPLEQLCRSAARSIQESDQQLGQAREEVKRLLAFVEKASRLDTSQTCSPGNEDVVLEAMEILSTTPSDGCGKGRTDKERLDWLELENFSLERQWNLETKGPGGVRLDVTSSKDHWKEPTIREAIDKAMEEAFDKGKEGV